jgi:hypothetical protein
VKPTVGGSDSHTLCSLGKTWTEVPNAASAHEFLAGLRRGHGVPCGESGDYFKLTSAVCRIGWSLVRSKSWALPFAALIGLAPAVTLGNYLRELAFAWYWGQKNRDVEPAGVTPAAAI